MSTNTLKTRIRHAYKTEAEWASSNPVLLAGEEVYSSDNNKKKIGNGTSKWSELSYVIPSKSDIGLGNVPNVATNDQTPTFTQASSRANISSGEKLSVIFGKLMKWFADLKTVAFTGSYTDLSNKPTIPTNTNQLTNGAGYITSSGTAKTISDTLPISKGGTGQTTGVNAANALINSLGTGDTTPTDADYYISQYVGGGTTTTTYHRRPMSALWNYIKSKLSTVATSGSYNDLSNKPTIPTVGNGTVTIKQAGTSKGTFTMNQSGDTTIELTDNNTTYSSKSAASGGTDVSLVTTGEKYTWNNKANASHGNHVPTTQTANNAVFLRNDNTWQTVTPANIGAAASGHTHSAYVNQNAFSNVVVGSTTVAADSATDTLTLVAGSNVTLTPDATNDKITIAAKDTTYGIATTSSNGLMSSSDKTKMNSLMEEVVITKSSYNALGSSVNTDNKLYFVN